MAVSSFFHVGVVVPALDAAMEHLGDLLGLTWTDPVVTDVPVLVASTGQERTMPLRMAYSRQAPHIELIQAVPGSCWELSTGSNFHHIGFWAEGIDTESARFGDARCPLAFSQQRDGAMVWAYHEHPLGLRFELVDAASRPMMEAWFAGT